MYMLKLLFGELHRRLLLTGGVFLSKERSIRELVKIEGIGRTTIKKLEEQGFNTIEKVAVTPLSEIADIIGSSQKAKIILREAQKIAGMLTFITAVDVFEKRLKLKRLTTGCKAIDGLFGGRGIDVGCVVEVYGEYRTGKTQLCHQLCVTVNLPEEKGGLNGGAIYLDTENTFRPERIRSIAERFDLDPRQVLEKIMYARVYNTDHLSLLLDTVPKKLEEINAKLVIVDSLISPFRAEYIGRETLAVRQQKIYRILKMQVLRIAELYETLVVITNQVMAKPEQSYFSESYVEPTGGHVLAHNPTYRLFIRKGKGDMRIIRLVKSPEHPEREAVFRITDRGIEDVEGRN